MAHRFRGNATHKVDQKGRVSIPATFRRVLELGDPDWSEGRPPTLLMVVGMRDEPMIECYTVQAMEALEDRILTIEDYFDRETLLRDVVGRAQAAEMDETGRIVLGQRIRDAVAITDAAEFVGQLDKFQIWSPPTFAARSADDRARINALPRDQNPYRHLGPSAPLPPGPGRAPA